MSSKSSPQNYNQRQRLMTPNLRSLGSKEITLEVIGVSQLTFDIPGRLMGLTHPQTGNWGQFLKIKFLLLFVYFLFIHRWPAAVLCLIQKKLLINTICSAEQKYLKRFNGGNNIIKGQFGTERLKPRLWNKLFLP